VKPFIRTDDVGRRSTKYSIGASDQQVRCTLLSSIAYRLEDAARKHAPEGDQAIVVLPVGRRLYDVGPDIHLR